MNLFYNHSINSVNSRYLKSCVKQRVKRRSRPNGRNYACVRARLAPSPSTPPQFLLIS